VLGKRKKMSLKEIAHIHMHEHWEVIQVHMKDFLHKAGNEVDETKEATTILKKEMSGLPVTVEEKEKVREQLFDLLKTAGIAVPFALIPGASVILPFLIKFAESKGVRILPSSFEKPIEKNNGNLRN
jgi:hypothetical protein